MDYGSYSPVPGRPSPRYYAMAGMILGIMSLTLVIGWAGILVSGIAGLVLGIVGVVLATKAKKSGYVGGMCTTGLVLSIIGIVLHALPVAAVTCGGCGLGCMLSCSACML